MKKILTLLLLCTLFAACGDKDDDTPPLVVETLKLSKDSVSLDNNMYYATIDIESGKGAYTAISSDEKVALVEIDNKTNKLYIMGIGIGTATIKVTDANGLKGTVKVNIETLILLPVPVSNLVFIKVGETKTIPILEEIKSNYFAVSEDESIATISLANKEVTIKGISLGEVELYITELIWPRWGYGVKVVDKYPLFLSGSQIDVSVGSDAAYFHIIYGNGDYTFTSSNPTVADIEEVLPYTGHVEAASNGKTIKLKALKSGPATITVTDAEKMSKTINVRVF